MIDGFVREEVYYREALSLGLDRDDAVIRRRLQQKMKFLTDSGADLLEPVAGDLEAYFADNKQTYSEQPRLSFEQIYLGETPSPETVTGLLNTLGSDPATDPSVLGERSLLPAQLGLSRPEAIDGTFGEGFFERITKIQPGAWAGPVKSGYGVHLVHILDSLPARTPPLGENLRIAADGTVQYEKQIAGQFTSRLHLKDFPFDNQALRIRMASFTYGQDVVRFVPYEFSRAEGLEFAIDGWNVIDDRPDLA